MAVAIHVLFKLQMLVSLQKTQNKISDILDYYITENITPRKSQFIILDLR